MSETKTDPDGTFAFDEVEPGSYRAAIGPKTFSEPYAGVSWLGADLIVPAIMVAYIWVWAGFAMVVIAAGLAAIPRDLLEAARTDGANEWQVFRRITIPLLAPVLTVVFITMLIYVLKVFDIVIAIAPGSVRGRRERDRPRDVAHVVRRRQRLRARVGDRRLPLPARHSNPGREHPSLPERGLDERNSRRDDRVAPRRGSAATSRARPCTS